MVRQHCSGITPWLGPTHKSHKSQARTETEIFVLKKKSCTAPGSKGGSPTQITSPSRSSHNLHTDPPSCRSTRERSSSSPSPFFFFFFEFFTHPASLWTSTLRPCHVISFAEPFSLAKSQKCGPNRAPESYFWCQVFGHNATSFSFKASAFSPARPHGAVSPMSPSDSRAHRSFDVGPSLLMAATAFIATFAFCHPSTSALPSIRHSFLGSHLQHEQTLHIEPAGSSYRTRQALCGEAASSAILLEGRTAPEKNAVMIRNGSLCRVLDSVLRSLLNGRVSSLTRTHRNARCPQRTATTTFPPTDAHPPVLPGMSSSTKSDLKFGKEPSRRKPREIGASQLQVHGPDCVVFRRD